ncbi:MAG: hypothetical protein RR186_02060 [Raoultibacter sp.]
MTNFPLQANKESLLCDALTLNCLRDEVKAAFENGSIAKDEYLSYMRTIWESAKGLQVEFEEARLKRERTEEKPSELVGIKEDDKLLPSYTVPMMEMSLEHLATLKRYRLAVALMGVTILGCLAFIAYWLL